MGKFVVLVVIILVMIHSNVYFFLNKIFNQHPPIKNVHRLLTEHEERIEKYCPEVVEA